jgi:hypothetical protein
VNKIAVLAASLVASFALAFAVYSAESNTSDSDQDIWRGYTAEQKQLAIAGFADCYRTASPNNGAFAQSDLVATVRIVDERASSAREDLFGNLILQSITRAPVVKPDVHSEHWEGATGFHSGLWWRGIDERDRQAYLQGVFWCTQSTNTITISGSQQSVQQAVSKLNDWYVISDDDWKDPRSNARVDVSVVSALQKTEILRIRKAKQ